MASNLGALIESNTIEPHHFGVGRVKRGQTIRIVDIEGQQVADFVSFKADDPGEYCDVLYSCWKVESYRLTEGHELITNHCNPLWTITEDDVRVHYCGGGFCSRAARMSYGVDDQKGCRDTLQDAFESLGYAPRDLHESSCFNAFMHFEYGTDGSWKLREPLSKPGDHIDLRAEMDLQWVVSVCAWPDVINGPVPTPLRFELYEAP